MIPTRGCSWALSKNGGCSVCGYINDSSREHTIPSDRILNSIGDLIAKTKTSKPIELKIFNSGSFFDNKDVPQELKSQIIKLLKKNPSIRKLSVESRPEYLLENYDEIISYKNSLNPINLEIGIGLESSNNTILRDCWNKGFSFEDYKESVEKIRSQDIKIKTYVFVKPPFLTELEAINDTIQTIQDVFRIGTDIISVNPCNIQKGTLVDHLFKKDKYQPPWLWSILYIIQEVKKLLPELKIICEPSGAGKQRGVHNCGKCDKIVLTLIQKSIDNDPLPKDFSEVCSCFTKWKLLIDTPLEVFRSRNLSKLRKMDPLRE